MTAPTRLPVPDVCLRAYTEVALWSSTDDDGTPLDRAGYPLAPETLDRFREDIRQFYTDHADLITAAELGTDNGPEQLMHDLWLTRNGHGAGFWDGDWGAYGEPLTKAAKTMGTCDLYVGDDAQIHAF